MPGQFLVGQAGARRVANRHLPLEKIAQQGHRLRRAAQRKAQIRRHRPDVVILRIFQQDLEILLEGVAGLAPLQKLLRLRDTFRDFGSIRPWTVIAE